MLRRTVPLLAALVVVGAVVASATSLGALTGTALWGVTEAEEACTLPDPTADVTFHDGLVGSLVQLLLTDLTGLLDVDHVQLAVPDAGAMAGDCEDVRPVLVVIGDHDADGGTADQVLARVLLAPITDADKGTTVTLEVPDDATDDELDALLGLFGSVVPTEVRVGFCPVGVTACEP